MGIESFYANIKIENINIEDLNNIFNDNKTFQLAMAYHWDDVDKELSIKATLVSFLPACELLYKLCQIITTKAKIIEIETRKERHAFNFENFIDFFSWFYTCWEERLKNFNNEWGAFVVSSANYYKARRKLRKKYMLKY